MRLSWSTTRQRSSLPKSKPLRHQEEYYDAKVTVLSEMITHHVKEEEQPGGMFAKARKSDMDLAELGQRLAARKKQLMNSSRTLFDTARAQRAWLWPCRRPRLTIRSRSGREAHQRVSILESLAA
jgi:hypothetical protein